MASDVNRLPRPQDFSKALYTFDIGQNDLAAGFRTMSMEELRATIPDIISQFAEQIRVSSTDHSMIRSDNQLHNKQMIYSSLLHDTQ